MTCGRLLRTLGATAIVAIALVLAACGSGSPSLVGVWQADDGTGLKTVSDDGRCTGMYYNAGKPLDIGGGMRCILGEQNDDGTYILVVQQPPNERSYRVRFDGSDTAVLLSGGEVVVTLQRQ